MINLAAASDELSQKRLRHGEDHEEPMVIVSVRDKSLA